MNILLAFVLAYAMGAISGMPLGPVQVEVAKRALHNRIGAAVMVILGAGISDVVYGLAAFFGLAPFLQNETVIAIVELVEMVVLAGLGVFTLRSASRTHVMAVSGGSLADGGVSFMTGLSLAIVNPLIVLWWVILATLAREMGLVTDFPAAVSIPFVLCGALGLASYFLALALILRRLHKWISEKTMRRISYGMGFFLIGLSIYFCVRACLILL